MRNTSPKINNNAGKFGYVHEIRGSYYHIRYDDGCEGQGTDADYTKVSDKKTIMQKVSIMMKKLLDSDTQTLVKAGYINGDLDLTETGLAALHAVQFDANKAALVVMAQADLDEAKADAE